MLTKLVTTLNIIAEKGFKFIFPIHHRTKQKITNLNLKFNENIKQMAPLGYLDFMKYVKNSCLVVTDSGGIQEETTFLGIHCITLRDNTERPSTLLENGGTNVLSTIEELEKNIDKFCGKRKDTNIELWDGFASNRIASIIASVLTSFN
jgi:UDP-N-acetylglucosamine 2-epimerase (non-hydrolysing)